MYKPESIDENKKIFIDLLRMVDRKGIEPLLEYLETKTDFYTAPSRYLEILHDESVLSFSFSSTKVSDIHPGLLDN